MSNPVPNITWNEYFMRDSSHDWILMLAYGLRALWASIGILFNSSVVLITIKSKNLHSVCNWLIAFECFLAIFQDCSYFVSFVVVTSGIKFIRYEICFPILIPLALCGEAAQMTMLFTGIDRLISVLFPVWYKKRNGQHYTAFVSLCIGIYICYVSSLYYIDYTQEMDFILSCSTNEMGQSYIGQIMKIGGLTLSALLMTVYGSVGFIMFCIKSLSKTISDNNRRLIKSLIFIISLNLVGVFLKSTIGLVMTALAVNEFYKRGFSTIFSFLTITVYSANAPVLYIMSNEYRSRLNTHFPFIQTITFNKFLSQSQIVPMQPTGYVKSINSSSRQSFVITRIARVGNNGI